MLTKILLSAVFQKVVRAVVLSILKELSGRSDNKIDDEVVKAVEEAWQ
jgi:hypothetical protein